MEPGKFVPGYVVRGAMLEKESFCWWLAGEREREGDKRKRTRLGLE